MSHEGHPGFLRRLSFRYFLGSFNSSRAGRTAKVWHLLTRMICKGTQKERELRQLDAAIYKALLRNEKELAVETFKLKSGESH